MNFSLKSKWFQCGAVCFLYSIAALVIGLNITLIFDNVLWGDEAFSANMIQNNLKGMMQIIHYWDSHPPLYYFWLKLCSTLLGYNSYVYHFASLIPYLGSVILALVCFPKRFGHIPTAVFLIFTGLASECLTYNVEVRMYSIASFFVLCGIYAAYLIIAENRKSAWFWMVLCGLLGAYSHLYVFMIMGLVIFYTSCIHVMKRGRKAVSGAIIAHICYIVGYIPWFYHLYLTMGRMVGSWWMTAPASLKEAVDMIFGGASTRKLLLPALAILMAAVLVMEFRKNALKLKVYSDETLFLLLGNAVVVSTFIVSYGASYLIKPLLARRYVYPLTAVVALLLVITISSVIRNIQNYYATGDSVVPVVISRGAFIVLSSVLLVIGLQNYKAFYDQSMQQDKSTQEILELIGEDPEYLVSDGVSHLTWSVFGYYYPETEAIEIHTGAMTADDFWFFTEEPMTDEELEDMTERGYKYKEYLNQVFVKYDCQIYHFERS